MGDSEFEKNMALLKATALALGPLLERVVFVGGVTTVLYFKEAIHDVRATVDVDVIVDISREELADVEEELRGLGFQPDPELICRHRKDDLILDFMPTDSSVLGFSSRWDPEAFGDSRTFGVGGVKIKALSFPYFVATKLEAFNGRGEGDYLGSKDIEDLVAVFSGRPSFLRELRGIKGDLGTFIRSELDGHLKDQGFLSAIEGHIPRDARISPSRLTTDLEDLASIV